MSKPESLTDEDIHHVQDHLIELKGQNIPYGLHTFGHTPDKTQLDSTVDAIVSVDRSLLPKNAKVLAAEMDRRIVASGARELDNLIRAFSGGFFQEAKGASQFETPTRIRPARTSTASIRTRFPSRRHGRWASTRRSDAGQPREEARPLSGEDLVRHLGRRNHAARGRARVADFHLLGTKPVWDLEERRSMSR